MHSPYPSLGTWLITAPVTAPVIAPGPRSLCKWWLLSLRELGAVKGKSSRTKSRTPQFWPSLSPIGLHDLGLSFFVCGVEEQDYINLGPFQLWRCRNLSQEESLSHAASPVPAQVWGPLLHMAKGNGDPPAVPSQGTVPGQAGSTLPVWGKWHLRLCHPHGGERGTVPQRPWTAAPILFPGIGPGPGLDAVLPKAGLQRAADRLLEADMQDSGILQENAFPCHSSHAGAVQNSADCA